MKRDPLFVLLLGCFFLSGFAGLLYETTWTRQFAFVFGTSELAIVTVLAAYFGGLTLGATMGARFGCRVRRPVLVYGLIELGIAVTALSVPAAINAATWLQVVLFGGHSTLPEAGGLVSTLFYLACSFAILMVPTALMGATLPLLARQSVRVDDQLGPRVGWLYAVNTFGAVAGTLCAAFVLLPALGLGRTVWVGVAANALVFVGAVLLSRGMAPTPPSSSPALHPVHRRDTGATSGGRLILPLILVSGAVSFSYEVLWTRLLGHILGGSVYAFATMLASFLLGIAIGSAIATRRAQSPSQAARAFGWAQIGTALLMMLAFLAVDRLPAFARWLGAGATSGVGANACVAAIVLLPGALCIGATFPLAVRVLARDEIDAGPSSGRIYAWNTVGAILGTVATGFVILPTLNYGGTLTAAVAMNLALAAIVGFAPSLRPAGTSTRASRAGLTAIVGFVVLAFVRPGEPWSVLRNSALRSRGQMAGEKITHYGVGRSATVLLTEDVTGWTLRTNGLKEASVQKPQTLNRLDSAKWLTALPVLARPEARKMLVVGLGGGNFLEIVPASITSIDIVELEPEVLTANQSIASRRVVDPLADPRVHVILNDARAALQLTSAKFDIIVSQPSHPWTAGASHLYTREFFTLLREHLATEGVFVQWMGLPFVDEPLLKSLVATLVSVFDHVRVYRPSNKQILFLASANPLPVEETAAALLTGRGDYARIAIMAPEDLAVALTLDESGARSFSSGAPIITDDSNYLQMDSPKAMLTPCSAQDWAKRFESFAPRLDTTWTGHRRYLVRRILARGDLPRALRVAQATSDPVDRQVCIGIVRLARRQNNLADRLLREALKRDPESPGARFELVQMHRGAYLEGDSKIRALASGATELQHAVFEGWRLLAKESWDELASLDSRLAKARPTDDAYAEAVRLRALWRVQSGDPELAREAVLSLDRLLLLFSRNGDLFLLARAVLAVGDGNEIVSAARMIRARLKPTARGRQFAKALQPFLRSLPKNNQTRVFRRQLRPAIWAVLKRGGS